MNKHSVLIKNKIEIFIINIY